MGRLIASIVVGFAVWSAAWLAGNMLIFSSAAKSLEAKQPLTDTGTLAGVLALSLVCSLLAGLSCGRIARTAWFRAGIILGVVLLGVGAAVQASAWDLMPVWYHASFLALLVPVTLIGSSLGGRTDTGT